MAFGYHELKERLQAIPDMQDRFMLAVSYANGTRVSEALAVKAEDIDVTENFVYISTPVLKKRKGLIYRAPPISRQLEEWLAKIVVGYSAGKSGRLIGYSKRTAQRRFDQYFGCTSHSFRHTRATHCFTVLKMSSRMVAEYFKLSPRGLTDWIMRYGHLDRADIEHHLEAVGSV